MNAWLINIHHFCDQCKLLGNSSFCLRFLSSHATYSILLIRWCLLYSGLVNLIRMRSSGSGPEFFWGSTVSTLHMYLTLPHFSLMQDMWLEFGAHCSISRSILPRECLIGLISLLDVNIINKSIVTIIVWHEQLEPVLCFLLWNYLVWS